MSTQPEQDSTKSNRSYWVNLFFFVFGLLLLWQAFVQTDPVSIDSAVVFGGLLTFVGAKGLWKKV